MVRRAPTRRVDRSIELTRSAISQVMVSELMTQGSVDDLVHATNAGDTVSLRQRIKILQVQSARRRRASAMC